MFRSHPLRSSIGAAFAVLACLATGVRAGVASVVTPNPSYAGNPLRFTKFLPGGECYDEARILELSTSGTTITVRYAVESIPPMICGVSPPLGLDIDIGPREPGLYTVHAEGTYHGTPLPASDEPFEVLAAPTPPHSYQGLWWNAPAGSEAGWGLSIAHQGDALFVVWFTYDVAGRAWWLVATARRLADGAYQGDLFETTGPPYDTTPFPPLGTAGGPTATRVGSTTLTFADSRHGTFAYTVGGTTQTKSITREIFGTVAHDCPFEPNFDVSRAANATDLWWASPAASEAGWGIAIADQARADGRPVFFATWFTYDRDRRPLWLSTTAELDSQTGTFKGALLRTRGPAFNIVPFPPLGAPGGVTATPFGTAEFTVAYDGTMLFTSTVNRVQRDKRITRQVFGAPRAVCRYEAP